MPESTDQIRASLPAAPKIPASLTAWSLIGLGVGVALGVLGNLGRADWVLPLAGAVGPIGDLWMNALQMTVIPLVVTQMLSAVAGNGAAGSLGGLGGRALALFVAMLAVVGTVTMALTPYLIASLHVPAETLAALQSSIEIPEAARLAAEGGSSSLGDWIVGMVPRNPFAAAVNGDLLPLLVFTVLFALAVTRLPEEQRAPLGALFRASAAAMMHLITWILWATPVAVFAIILVLAVETGLGAAGMLGAYVLVLSGLLLAATGLLYPLTVVFGRASLRDFSRAVAPAQMVAVSTRSSLASLPALVDGGQRHLRLPPVSTGFVLPLAASTFKLNQGISPTFKFVFLATVFGVPLTSGQMASFLILVILLSFSTLGIPRGGTAFRTLPAYVAAGIPIEGVVVIEAVKTIPDIFMTLANSTAYMSVATLLSRKERARDRRPSPLGPPVATQAPAASASARR